ncbi:MULTISPECIES: DUF2776 family protein [Romboutsia]|uniref:Inner membrane protein YhiM n=1 Tax=Romboutsia hominis TaxID=1507512 RepID=A0A2P2BV61_9FIRM|nr:MULTISPECIES: DUF2776 family protein [Romboutsia]MCH1958936.1 DUF2776 domain-containing protein [Romboutsia hominis]MCH1968063.1 DUF2776 domain-containing protein [Romboutsia hominis]MDB8793960.1 DUF2776 family protein [Romboutsia sp. 1001216sp1]MDB8796887.1 DUF2776 family protein [Romboutsia sp. 1001216sp1]MDB8800101.1 DUF2776 family protein [Romboutsia sp. 1001216sp1]
MNYYISIFFRAIPLLMGVVCLGYGFYVKNLGQLIGSEFVVAGHVLIYLTAICIALFTTAATIIRQLINKYNNFDKWVLPSIGYLASIFTMVSGIMLFETAGQNSAYVVSGNVVFGLGLIACCVSTVATSSTKFLLIPKNSSNLKEGDEPEDSFKESTAKILISVPVVCALIAFIRGIYLLMSSSATENFVAGHVIIGISLVCASLVALVASVVRQIQNKFTEKERYKWSILVVILGTIDIIWGIAVLSIATNPAWIAPGFVLIGLGIVCYSILSKVLLLGMVWRKSNPLAKRVPLIPVVTALICLFMGAFLFEAEIFNIAYFIPARVMIGLGAICFTLFSIVSILESGTSSSK